MLLHEHRVEVARRCSFDAKFSLRCASKDWDEGARGAVESLKMRARVWGVEDDWGASLHQHTSGAEEDFLQERLKTQLKTPQLLLSSFPNLRRLSLRGAKGLNPEQLEILLAKRPRNLTEVDLTFARPLSWPKYGELKQQLEKEGGGGGAAVGEVGGSCSPAASASSPGMQLVRFRDVLDIMPSPEWSPRRVVEAQCYALHAGRIDKCFAFASPGNAENTGPLAKFEQMFQPPSLYGIMVRCDFWEIHEEIEQDPDSPPPAWETRASWVVIFRKRGGPSGTGEEMERVPTRDWEEQWFRWHVSKQGEKEQTAEGTSVAGCWMTDAVVPTNREELFWAGGMLDE